MTSKDEHIVFFYYPESAFQLRVNWYLKLAKVPHFDCLQPGYMPRPDLAAMGVSYRRIPVLSIGKHVYCDTRMILQVLQTRYPLESIKLSPADKGLEKLFRGWTIDGGIFRHATSFIPFEHIPLAKSSAFVADRADLVKPAPFDPDLLIKARPESMVQLRSGCELLESTFLADGRKWILGTERGPSVVDIEAVFSFYLVIIVWRAPSQQIKEDFPKTYAWVQRFHEAMTSAAAAAPKPQVLTGEEVTRSLLEAPETTPFAVVNEADPLGLKPGQIVEVWPTDSGSSGRQRGELVTLTTDEVCVRNTLGIYVHFPRWNFRVRPVREDAEKL